MKRRDLLALGAGALAGFPARALPQTVRMPRVRRTVRLGRTNLQVSDISFGSASTTDPAVVRHAFDRGVNYFDTAESYRWGGAEEAFGEALAPVRNQVIIATKTKAGATDTRRDMMKALEGSLRRLRTDRIDVYFNHAVDDVARMRNPEWREFTDLARRQGKIRFRGMSGHGGELVRCIDYALDQDLVDVVLAAYSFAQDPSFADKLRHTFHWAAIQPGIPRVLEKARRKDVGVLAMKTLMGGRMNDLRPFEQSGGSFSQAALRWVLSSPNVDAALISMTSVQEVDEYLGASGAARVSARDLDLLARYAEARVGSYCLPGCGACAESCPAGVPIAEVLRTRMYAVDYADPVLARHEYAALEADAGACLSCTGQPCLGACPATVPIAAFTRQAAAMLS
ncbi:MAG: aldo/keto reductase [Betaproteobacteria bacterium]|nr:aldo/keto reductase [Rhodocyclaceae bacterium]MCA3134645.1 aldo/keto reductase [Rhodocyclaceae bacterium]MCA3143111.1 aldo/keto reductase [Rhodocyclaceae bacterium]MCA3144531.1 aldo/keto reductase [Rhodocyclaceae bacterium]MCE2898136.1 aldo/keto reductase [Betaproteobacteria bacterium]